MNIYSVNLYDVMIPPPLASVAPDLQNNGLHFNELFLVEEHFGTDLKKLIEKRDQLSL